MAPRDQGQGQGQGQGHLMLCHDGGRDAMVGQVMRVDSGPSTLSDLQTWQECSLKGIRVQVPTRTFKL